MRLHQEPIPCRLREATFVLDGLMEHETELDPRTIYTDTHGYTEVVMATAGLLGKSLAPRIAACMSKPCTSSTAHDTTHTWIPSLMARSSPTWSAAHGMKRPCRRLDSGSNRVAVVDPASAGLVRAPAQRASGAQ